MKDYYGEIDRAIKEFEEHKPYHTKSLSWVSDRICWCWKWKKISSEQKDELADRVIELYRSSSCDFYF